MIFKRKLYDEMLEWKTWNGQYALLIKGARRVGKSTLAKEFAQREYRSYNMKTPVVQMLVASGNKLFTTHSQKMLIITMRLIFSCHGGTNWCR